MSDTYNHLDVLSDDAGDAVTQIAGMGAAISDPHVVESTEAGKPHVFVVPDGYKVKTETFEEYAARPARASNRAITVRGEDSLITIAKAQGQLPRVYADPVTQSIVCVLNDDEHNEIPGWRDNRVTVALVQTREWQAWMANNGKLLPQAEFAEFIEDHYGTILSPSAADMLEIAQSLEASVGLRVKSSQRLRTGERKLVYEEEQTARAGFDGELTIPEELDIALVPWRGRGDIPIPMRARLRFRTTGGNVSMGYKIIDLEKTIEAAFAEITSAIEAADIEVITGTP